MGLEPYASYEELMEAYDRRERQWARMMELDEDDLDPEDGEW